MSGPQLAALVAVLVAAAALAGVAVLVVQVRRLRAELTASRSAPAPAPAPGSIDPPPAPASAPAPRSAPVVELVPVSSEPADGSQIELRRSQQVVAARLAQPLVRVSAVTYGFRHALRAENRDRIVALVRRDLRRRHKLRRLAGRHAFRVVHLRPDDSTGPGAGRQESAS